MQMTNTVERLNKIALNLWWTWNQETFALFRKVNKETWDKTHNPILTIKMATEDQIASCSKDNDFEKDLFTIEEKLNIYTRRNDTWYQQTYKDADNKNLVAYFSAEYGIHESLPIYSGGLGVLSGDHTKSASDLGIPMVFIGLFYKDGYFIQQINNEGKQVDVYNEHNPEDLPIELVLDKNGSPLMIEVDLAERKTAARVWKAQVGINPLYLLDTNVDQNITEDRAITARLYGGDREMRISQEIVLGIGGIKLLEALKLTPNAYHMNEGHSGFFQIERIRNTMKEKSINFEEAKIFCASNCLFTTHTPVPAGNETFSLPVMHKYFHATIKELDISWHRFIDLGLINHSLDHKEFSLTIFALNLSRFHNGVSELHGKIAEKMWKEQWPEVPVSENPIDYITNGIHVPTWMSLDMKNMMSEHLGADWQKELANTPFWEKILNLPHNLFKQTRNNFKTKMITLVRERLKDQLKRNGESQAAIDEVDGFLTNNAITIGFARRFATYKRATLIFQDKERLAKIVNDEKNPIQFIFAGKAHPQDIPGQKFIAEIYQLSRTKEFKGKIIILENYDMNISRHLVAGSDIWLNNPRRPMEASGTSGQKVPINGGINFSVLDGWWREGYNGENGWSIGEEKDYATEDIQDYEDANDFYNTLEQTILPLYYAQGESGLSDAWIDKSLVSLSSNIARYSTYRMVQDYMTKFYSQAITYGKFFQENSAIENYLVQRRFLKRNWETLTVTDVHFDKSVYPVDSNFKLADSSPSHHVDFKLDDTLAGKVLETSETTINFNLYTGDINALDLKIELVVTNPKDESMELHEIPPTGKTNQNLTPYQFSFKSTDGKPRRIRVRILPNTKDTVSKFEYGLISWL